MTDDSKRGNLTYSGQADNQTMEESGWENIPVESLEPLFAGTSNWKKHYIPNMHRDKSKPEFYYKFKVSNYLKCKHSDFFYKCQICLSLTIKNVNDISCEHTDIACLCFKCYHLITVEITDAVSTPAPVAHFLFRDTPELKLNRKGLFSKLLRKEKEKDWKYFSNRDKDLNKQSIPSHTPPLEKKLNDPTPQKKDNGNQITPLNSSEPTLKDKTTNIAKEIESDSEELPSDLANLEFILWNPFMCVHWRKIQTCELCSKTITNYRKIICSHFQKGYKCFICRDKITTVKWESENKGLELDQLEDTDFESVLSYELKYISRNSKPRNQEKDNELIKLQTNTDKNREQNNIKINTAPSNKKVETNKNNNNRYERLTEPNANDETPTINKENRKISRQPPPIFIKDTDLDKFNDIIKTHKLKFTEIIVKSTPKNKIKIKLKVDNGIMIPYNTLKRLLKEVYFMEFYTFKFRKEKTYKRIIKGLPPQIDLNKIKKEFEEYDLLDTEINQIYSKRKPIPLFKIEVKHKNKETINKLNNIKKLNGLEVKIEEMDPKFVEIPQCKICLQYEHSKNYCNFKIRCLICTQEHHKDECDILKSANETRTPIKPVCLHCKGDHFSTWKGCPTYQKLKRQKLKLKDTDSPEKTQEEKDGKDKDQIIKELNNKIREMQADHRNKVDELEKRLITLSKQVEKLTSLVESLTRDK